LVNGTIALELVTVLRYTRARPATHAAFPICAARRHAAVGSRHGSALRCAALPLRCASHQNSSGKTRRCYTATCRVRARAHADAAGSLCVSTPFLGSHPFAALPPPPQNTFSWLFPALGYPPPQRRPLLTWIIPRTQRTPVHGACLTTRLPMLQFTTFPGPHLWTGWTTFHTTALHCPPCAAATLPPAAARPPLPPLTATNTACGYRPPPTHVVPFRARWDAGRWLP